MSNIVKCHGCLGEFLKLPDQYNFHPYIGAIQECWQIYSEILAKEFNNQEYFKVHRITVDSYGAQHIGDQNDRRARQSANVHLIALYLYFGKKLNAADMMHFIQKATIIKRDWPPIHQIDNPQWLTVNDVIKAKDVTEHTKLVLEWGKSIWESYSDYQYDIINTYEKFNDTF